MIELDDESKLRISSALIPTPMVSLYRALSARIPPTIRHCKGSLTRPVMTGTFQTLAFAPLNPTTTRQLNTRYGQFWRVPVNISKKKKRRRPAKALLRKWLVTACASTIPVGLLSSKLFPTLQTQASPSVLERGQTINQALITRFTSCAS